ncbi:MAG TPA: hypothetical protein VMF11_15755 [Candidatus Baltobacteraceae bacterium]|nr:hypothetical protein [Candidatus Baltobacteraceae bacterium]
MEVRCHVGSFEEGVLRVLYEAPASACECAAALLHYGYATEVVTGEVEALLDDLVKRGCAFVVGEGMPERYALSAAGSERLASLVETA